jgi:hypothetical protein
MLRKEKIIEVIDAEGHEIDMIISNLRGHTYVYDSESFRFNEILDHKRIAEIISNIFSVDYNLVYNTVSKSTDLADRSWNTPDWDAAGWFKSSLHDEMGFSWQKSDVSSERLAELENEKGSLLKRTILEVYVRSIIYIRMASLYGLNYSPDSIRIPIVEYIHSALIEKINDDTQNLIAQVRIWHGNHIESSNYLVGYEKLVIETPSFLGLVLTKCETKDKFLETAIEGAALGMNIVSQDFGTMLSSLATAMGFVKPVYQLFNYLRNPRIMLLHDLKKRLSHVIRINKDIKEIFKSDLSSQEISKLTRLKALNENMLAENYFP